MHNVGKIMLIASLLGDLALEIGVAALITASSLAENLNELLDANCFNIEGGIVVADIASNIEQAALFAIVEVVLSLLALAAAIFRFKRPDEVNDFQDFLEMSIIVADTVLGGLSCFAFTLPALSAFADVKASLGGEALQQEDGAGGIIPCMAACPVDGSLPSWLSRLPISGDPPEAPLTWV